MKFEDLPKKLQALVKTSKHGSLTIQNDISDALENADDTAEFCSLSMHSLEILRDEANYYWNILNEELEKT